MTFVRSVSALVTVGFLATAAPLAAADPNPGLNVGTVNCPYQVSTPPAVDAFLDEHPLGR